MNRKHAEEEPVHYSRYSWVRDWGWTIHQRCKGSVVCFCCLSPQSLRAEVAVDCCQSSNPDFYWDDRKTHQLDFDGTWQWGHSTDASYTPSEHTCIFYPFAPPPACLGLLCPSPATTQRWYKRGSLAICILLPLLFQIAVLSFTSYKPKIPKTLSTKVVVPFSEGLGERREASIPSFTESGEESVCCWPLEPR